MVLKVHQNVPLLVAKFDNFLVIGRHLAHLTDHDKDSTLDGQREKNRQTKNKRNPETKRQKNLGEEVDISSAVNEQTSDFFAAVVRRHVQRCETALHIHISQGKQRN